MPDPGLPVFCPLCPGDVVACRTVHGSWPSLWRRSRRGAGDKLGDADFVASLDDGALALVIVLASEQPGHFSMYSLCLVNVDGKHLVGWVDNNDLRIT